MRAVKAIGAVIELPVGCGNTAIRETLSGRAFPTPAAQRREWGVDLKINYALKPGASDSKVR